jgi:probable DNA repair protein
MQARARLSDWAVETDHPAWRGEAQDNHVAFRRWKRSFDARCRRDGWLAPEDRAPHLAEEARNGRLSLGVPIALLGFDELNPLQAKLIDSLRSADSPVSRLAFPAAGGTTLLWRADDPRDELDRMARWVRYWFEREPDARIAVVVPDLEQRQDDIERALREVLLPGSTSLDSAEPPWNVSLGRPLIRSPMVAIGLRLLRLARSRVSIRDVGEMLRSPFLRGDGEEWSRRAVLERLLRDRYPKTLELRELVYRSGEMRRYTPEGEEVPETEREARPWHCPAIHRCALELQRFERETRGRRTPSDWAKAFDSLLSSLGWALDRRESANSGQPGADSADWPVRRAWQEALRDLASLDAISGPITRDKASRSLEQVCRDRLHRPEGPPARIQVLGPYEVCGLRFDHLWVLGLHGDNWPRTARPDPFIPLALQREAGMPRSSPDRELSIARTVTRRLLETAEDTVLSYPGLLDGEPTLASPLFSGPEIETGRQPAAWSGDSWREAVFRAEGPQVEVPAKPSPCSEPPLGGSSLLRRQALCPFRAFARNRLDAEGLETPIDGIDPRLHGSLTHRTLEGFWRETRDHATLVGLEDETLQSRVRAHAERSIENERGLRARPAMRQVEQDRLVRLVGDALRTEREREPFEAVGFEQDAEVQLAGQAVRLRIDRIDRLPTGESVIIDYKTGKANPGKWFGERPEDPQLPLYAVAADTPPAAVVFVQLRTGENGYAGVVSREGIVPGLPPKHGSARRQLIAAGEDLPVTVDRWRAVLNGLMEEFLSGHAPVDPIDGDRTCSSTYCRLAPLCRIGELQRLAGAVDTE